jgi:hypothetical protein
MDKTCTRGLPYLIVDPVAIQSLEEYQQAFQKAFSIISKFVFDHFAWKKGLKEPIFDEQNKIIVPTFNRSLRLQEEPKKIFLNQYIKEKIDPLLSDSGITTYTRNLVQVVLANYDSYVKRHKQFPAKPISLVNNNSIRFEDAILKDNGSVLHMPGTNGQRYQLPYVHPGSSKRFKPLFNLNKSFGGHFVNTDKGPWKLIVKYDKPIDYQYAPENWIGSDFNQYPKYWVVLWLNNKSFVVAKPEKLVVMEAEIKQVNFWLTDKDHRKTIKGGKRRYLNNKRVELHQKHKKTIKPFVEQILELCVKNKAGISIDNVAPGRQTWGQDKLRELFFQLCQDRGVPYYRCNPSYTSQACSECGYRDKRNLNSKRQLFKCLNCGYEDVAHINSAKNSHNIASVEGNTLSDK